MDNNQVIKKFYSSFSEGNSNGMIECYHENVFFQDPAFGILKGDRAKKMWEMLLSQKNTDIKITFDHVTDSGDSGKVNWVAEYSYGKKRRKVINHVSANFKFQDGKIIEHIDTFDLWKWTKQAMGPVGYLLGWSSFMKNKIQKTTNSKLNKYISK